jgi:hypothetical protein
MRTASARYSITPTRRSNRRACRSNKKAPPKRG